MTRTMMGAQIGTLLITTTISHNIMAEEKNARIEGAIIGAYQAASRSGVHGEGSGRIELEGALDMGPGTFHMEVVGNTTPRNHGVSSIYDTNALADETLNSHGNGRLAVKELYYKLPLGPGKLSVGLMEPLDRIDEGEIAHEENNQFMADAFTDNLSIGAPDFVLGAQYQGDLLEQLSYRLWVSSDSGLEEDDDPTYDNVFALGGHRDGHRKGAFTAGELKWHADGYWAKGGIWYDTGKVDRMGRDNGRENGYGIYALAGAPLGPGRVEGRVGFANKKAQDEADFQSLAYELPMQLFNRDTALGLAAGRTGASSRIEGRSASIYQAEAYWRFDVMGPLHVSPDIQYVKHGGFESDRGGAVIGGMRVGLEF